MQHRAEKQKIKSAKRYRSMAHPNYLRDAALVSVKLPSGSATVKFTMFCRRKAGLAPKLGKIPRWVQDHMKPNRHRRFGLGSDCDFCRSRIFSCRVIEEA
jgi:hypothetical protein